MPNSLMGGVASLVIKALAQNVQLQKASCGLSQTIGRKRKEGEMYGVKKLLGCFLNRKENRIWEMAQKERPDWAIQVRDLGR